MKQIIKSQFPTQRKHGVEIERLFNCKAIDSLLKALLKAWGRRGIKRFAVLTAFQSQSD
jgi:hypothetical protein